MEDIEKKLHPHEKKILLALQKLTAGTPAQISRHSKLPEASVHKAGMWVKVKNLVEEQTKITESAEITEEGERYLKEGLPEVLLARFLYKGSRPVTALGRHIPALSVALAWAKAKGLVEFSEKNIRLTKNGREFIEKRAEDPAMEALRQAKTNHIVSDLEILRELKKRRLVETRIRKEKIFKLTKEGRALVPKIKTAKDQIGLLTTELIKTGRWKAREFRPYDVNTPVPKIIPAKLHFYTNFRNMVRKKLVAMGFEEVKSGYVELEFWNSDALFMPQDHPARGIHDIFKISSIKSGSVRDRGLLDRVSKTHKNGWITGSIGWGHWDPQQTVKAVMRSQTTAVSARTLATIKPDSGKYFTIDRCFRPDVLDANHSFEFDQCEGIVIGEHLTLKHLLGFLEIFGKEIAGAEQVRFRPSYFPFTEPSVEMDCLVNGKWLEVVGSGIFRPEVTKPLGIDKPVLAWGFGFARLAMIKLGITDIRDLFTQDLSALRTKGMQL